MANSEEILKTAVKAADDKSAEEIVALDMRNVSLLADYFLIMHAGSERQVEAIVDEIQKKVEALGGVEGHVEGKKGSKWVLIDFKDVVVHVFVEEERRFYNLEKLWADAPEVDLKDWIAE
ncbi:ribosome silencing factor [Lapidilactobacillus mulanensis]|uniref:Ribosomal silencing factor RsfS n=1 Tax=Lapidilactobacillus mulanensis TaxID=2485999 RepID=A0ABW4DQM4_9LACO|nr:ribosome silencing factor [Lapidilactobacillus mulanensis]